MSRFKKVPLSTEEALQVIARQLTVANALRVAEILQTKVPFAGEAFKVAQDMQPVVQKDLDA